MFFGVTRLSQAMSVGNKKDSGKSHTPSTNLLQHFKTTSVVAFCFSTFQRSDVVQNLSTCGPTRGLVFVIKIFTSLLQPWDSSILQRNTVLGSRINIINGIKKCRDSHIICLLTSRILVCWVKLLVRTTILTSCFGHGPLSAVCSARSGLFSSFATPAFLCVLNSMRSKGSSR